RHLGRVLAHGGAGIRGLGDHAGRRGGHVRGPAGLAGGGDRQQGAVAAGGLDRGGLRGGGHGEAPGGEDEGEDGGTRDRRGHGGLQGSMGQGLFRWSERAVSRNGVGAVAAAARWRRHGILSRCSISPRNRRAGASCWPASGWTSACSTSRCRKSVPLARRPTPTWPAWHAKKPAP